MPIRCILGISLLIITNAHCTRVYVLTRHAPQSLEASVSSVDLSSHADGSAVSPRADGQPASLDAASLKTEASVVDARNPLVDNCISYMGSCWILGATGANCDKTCNAALRAFNPSGMVNAAANTVSGCQNIYTAVIGAAPTSNTSQLGYFGFCGKLNNDAKISTFAAFSGENYLTTQQPLCACTTNTIAAPGNFQAVASGQDYALSWTTSSGQSGFLILRGTAAATFAPTDGVTYSVGAQGAENIIFVGYGTSFLDVAQSSLEVYSIWAYDADHHYSPKVEAIGARCPGGWVVRRMCWFRGASQASCDATCAAVGGTFDVKQISSVIVDGNECGRLHQAISGVEAIYHSSSLGDTLCGRLSTDADVAWFPGGVWSGAAFQAFTEPYCTCTGF